MAHPQSALAQMLPQLVLERQIDPKLFQKERPLKEALELLLRELRTDSAQLPILVDTEAFKAENPDAYPTADSFYETTVMLPRLPPAITGARALRLILSFVPTKNATYVVMPDHILVTTMTLTAPEHKLQTLVQGSFERRPLHVALTQLSQEAGVPIVIDSRATENAKRPVSATFLQEVELGSALRVLTEMAELKVIVLEKTIFVTTPAHVDVLRKEFVDRGKSMVRVRVPTYAPPFNFFGCLPFSDPQVLVDPFWPYGHPGGGPAGSILSPK
jgi:hypothetical protein